MLETLENAKNVKNAEKAKMQKILKIPKVKIEIPRFYNLSFSFVSKIFILVLKYITF